MLHFTWLSSAEYRIRNKMISFRGMILNIIHILLDPKPFPSPLALFAQETIVYVRNIDCIIYTQPRDKIEIRLYMLTLRILMKRTECGVHTLWSAYCDVSSRQIKAAV